MVSYHICIHTKGDEYTVLILVVVDNSLVQSRINFYVEPFKVLILIVVDNSLVLLGLEKMLKQDIVLILIVVDNSLVQNTVELSLLGLEKS